MVSPPTCPAVAPLTPRPEEPKGLQRPNRQIATCACSGCTPARALACHQNAPQPPLPPPSMHRTPCTRVNERTCRCAALAQGSSVQGAQWPVNGLGVQPALTSGRLHGWSPTPPQSPLPLLFSSSHQLNHFSPFLVLTTSNSFSGPHPVLRSLSIQRHTDTC